MVDLNLTLVGWVHTVACRRTDRPARRVAGGANQAARVAIHPFSAMLLSGYNLFGGAVNEAYLRIRPLRSMAGDNILGSRLVGITHGVVMLLFVALIVGYLAATIVSRARRGPAAHPQS